jgi:hypothetical protein
LVTNYQIEKFDELIEYRKNSTKKIIAGNLWNDAPHLPGIIFNSQKAKLILKAEEVGGKGGRRGRGFR